MNTEEFKEKLSEITDDELIQISKSILIKLCSTGGRSFTMTVPVQLNDTDIIISELIKRFEVSIIISGNESQYCTCTCPPTDGLGDCEICYKPLSSSIN